MRCVETPTQRLDSSGAVPVPANVSGVPGHHWAATIAEASSIAHKGEVAGAKVLAGSMIDALTKPEIVAKAKETFRQETGGTAYKPLLPMDQKPPLTLNEQEMAKYRDQMKKFYLNVPIDFK